MRNVSQRVEDVEVFPQNAKRLEYYRRAHHRKGLPGPCLAVGKDAGIVTLEGTFYYVRTEIVENLKKKREERRRIQ